MKSKYVKNGSFWEEKKPPSCSATWNAMLTVREDMRDGYCWTVVLGEDINVWDDPWVPSLPNKKPERRVIEEHGEVRVKDLIIQEEHMWDENKLQQLFNQTEVTKIMEIHLPEANEDNPADKLIWIHHPKGNFSAKSFLKTMNARSPSTSTNYEFPWKKFWKARIIPHRIQIFMWRMLKNGLPMANCMKKHIQGINSSCRFCDMSVETTEHLFLHCQATQPILCASPLSLRTSEQPDLNIKDYIKQWLEEGGDYIKLKWGACVWWAIWKARNALVFNRESLNINSIIKKTMSWFNLEVSVGEIEDMPTETNYLETSKDSWEPPEENIIKINFDGAAGHKGFACGAVARYGSVGFRGC
ncbi:uncharacterized protein LOC113312008 [Papaver somniferum]|uniref:uncharacterized protein LOC113312008 n=1 Tax=Papaver somniferum TaxID=3469 RepID=UPI000E6F8668|nr:uncharacterized protein LOC113312008 [Papaver somniferum]